ncbi:histidine phosphatase family protein [Paenibacillus arenosi]|uniref:Histidine phosphatase family protein n=1 Tax=Paenibacillus arenosi TaxID=2774142 RepID=A0ABR9AU21_9BACL|nr:histidine phosphatase family protein [Paenibacillus arenosi]MBD8497605.1 histidine phosphatase family protein [Paenibacillus arenosi]
MNKQQIGLVRHGQTDWNALGRIQGQTDIPLNDIGRDQAMKLAARLVHEPYRFDAVISSGLQRAEETAAIIASHLQIPLLEPHAGLLERAFGLAEGTTLEERTSRWGVDWKAQDVGQEKDHAIRLRAVEAVNFIANEWPDRNILIISHGSWLAQLFYTWFGEECTSHIGNLSFTIVERHEQKWEPLLLNCARHMEEPTVDVR